MSAELLPKFLRVPRPITSQNSANLVKIRLTEIIWHLSSFCFKFFIFLWKMQLSLDTGREARLFKYTFIFINGLLGNGFHCVFYCFWKAHRCSSCDFKIFVLTKSSVIWKRTEFGQNRPFGNSGRVMLGKQGNVEKMGVVPKSISPDNP